VQAVILIGIQGSGKSTFYSRRFFHTHVRLSRDLVRTRHRELALMRTCLSTGQPFVIDDTNTLASVRAAFLAEAKAAGFRVCGYFLDVPLADAMRRNAGRTGKQRIPPAGVAGTHKRLEPPTLEEGFDELHRVKVGAAGEFETEPMFPSTAPLRIFLLSPASASGERARMLRSTKAQFELARRLRTEGAPLGEVFSFISGLYFRGKLAYAGAFASPPAGVPGVLVITAGRGLIPPDTKVRLEDLEQIAATPIDAADPRYREPLARHAAILSEAAGPDCDIILLGSVATLKYVEPLVAAFGARLLFPGEFAGRGDMSRGGLLLRAARSGVPLRYVPVGGVTHHGPKPPRLPREKAGM
jgi:predicted kinase